MSSITARSARSRPCYLPAGLDIADLTKRIKALDGIDVALSKAEACERFELPADRIGDIVVISTKHKVLGTARDKHDLSGLDRAAAQPWRPHRAARAADRQSPPEAAGRSSPAQLRRVRRRPQPRPSEGATPCRRRLPAPSSRSSATRRCASPARRSSRRACRGAQPLRPTRWSARCRRLARARWREAFRIGNAYKPKLTTLRPPADPAQDGRDPRRPQGRDCPLITAELGLCLEGLALRGRPRLRRLFAGRPARDPRRRRDLFLRYHSARQAAQDLHLARTAAGRASRRSRHSIIRSTW